MGTLRRAKAALKLPPLAEACPGKKSAPAHSGAGAPPPGEAPENAEHAIVGTVELSAYFHLRQPEEKLNHQVVGEIQTR